MPRSEKFYTFLLVGIMSLVVIISMFAAIKNMRGEVEPRPVYERAPSTSLFPPPSDKIADSDIAELTPIDDADFLLFRQTTRTLTPEIFSPQGKKQFRQVALDEGVVNKTERTLEEYRQLFTTQKHSRADQINIERPESVTCSYREAICERDCPRANAQSSVYICQQSRTTASVTFVPINTDGSPGAASTINAYYFWLETQNGWKVTQLDFKFSIAEESGLDESAPTPEVDTSDDDIIPSPETDPNAPSLDE